MEKRNVQRTMGSIAQSDKTRIAKAHDVLQVDEDAGSAHEHIMKEFLQPHGNDDTQPQLAISSRNPSIIVQMINFPKSNDMNNIASIAVCNEFRVAYAEATITQNNSLEGAHDRLAVNFDANARHLEDVITHIAQLSWFVGFRARCMIHVLRSILELLSGGFGSHLSSHINTIAQFDGGALGRGAWIRVWQYLLEPLPISDIPNAWVARIDALQLLVRPIHTPSNLQPAATSPTNSPANSKPLARARPQVNRWNDYIRDYFLVSEEQIISMGLLSVFARQLEGETFVEVNAQGKSDVGYSYFGHRGAPNGKTKVLVTTVNLAAENSIRLNLLRRCGFRREARWR